MLKLLRQQSVLPFPHLHSFFHVSIDIYTEILLPEGIQFRRIKEVNQVSGEEIWIQCCLPRWFRRIIGRISLIYLSPMLLQMLSCFEHSSMCSCLFLCHLQPFAEWVVIQKKSREIPLIHRSGVGYSMSIFSMYIRNKTGSSTVIRIFANEGIYLVLFLV